MVFHHRVGLQDVRADLVAPGDLAFLAVELVHLALFLVLLQLVDLRAQDLHGPGAVRMLAALGLAGHHDARRQVGQADRAVGLVDVLATGAAGPERVHAQILFVDFHFDVVADFRHHVERSEGGVPPLGGVERADAHQPVHAAFGLEKTVGPGPADHQRRALHAGFVAGLVVHRGDLEALFLAVAVVHAQQHGRPVARFGPARPRVQRQERVVGIELACHQGLQFDVLVLLFKRGDLFGHLDHVGMVLGHVAFVRQQAGHQFQLFLVGNELLVRPRHRLQRVLAVDGGPGRVLVVPEVGCGHPLRQFFDDPFFAVDVKDSLAFLRGVLSRTRCAWKARLT